MIAIDFYQRPSKPIPITITKPNGVVFFIFEAGNLMYESFFGLKEKAFNLTPDPDFLYLNSRTKKAFEDILYGIERREGFAVVVGDVGTGKTTLCCSLLEKIEGKKNIFTVLIQNPMLSELDILRSILQDLGVPQRVGAAWKRDMTKKELIDCLNTFLSENARDNTFTVLIIDESQNLSLEMLEQLRLLSNLETTKEKLLQIIFLGQPELDKKLLRLRQLNQRISVRFETQPLSREDTEKYIRHRLAIAGENHKVKFGPGALDAIHEHSRGYPRLINLICDRSLREACNERSFIVTKQMVRKAALSLAGTRKVPLKSRLKWVPWAAVILVILLAASLLMVWIANRNNSVVKSSAVVTQKPVVSVVEASAVVTQKPVVSPVRELPMDPVRTQPQFGAPSQPDPAPPPKSAAAAEYLLQVHSFHERDVADQTLEELRALNLSAFLEYQAVEGGRGWYGVFVGPFRDLATVQSVDSEIRAATGASPVLRQRAGRRENIPPQ